MKSTAISLSRISAKKLISGSCLVAGTAIGAGMLGIPLVTGHAGFFPAALISILVWGFMLTTGILLLDVAMTMPVGSNMLSIAGAFLGNKGKIAVGIMFGFLYYCLMVAYIAAGSPFLAALFENNLPATSQFILFTLIVGVLIYCGVKWVDRINIVLTAMMLFAYVTMLTVGFPLIDARKLISPMHFGSMFMAVPVLFGAFGYHNVIPSLCDYLERDYRVLKLSLIIGTTTALCIYLAWQYLVIGAATPQALQQAAQNGQTPVAALQQLSKESSIYLWGKMFGALALGTSLLGVSLSMVDFFTDGFRLISVNTNRVMMCVITFVPPLLFTIYNPKIFLHALGLAGGVGETLLNGLLPIALLWASKYAIDKQQIAEDQRGKLWLTFLFLLGVSVLGIECFDLMR